MINHTPLSELLQWNKPATKPTWHLLLLQSNQRGTNQKSSKEDLLCFSFSNFFAWVPLFVLVGLQLHILGRNTETCCTCSRHMGWELQLNFHVHSCSQITSYLLISWVEFSSLPYPSLRLRLLHFEHWYDLGFQHGTYKCIYLSVYRYINLSQTHILTITNGEPTERYDMRVNVGA